MAELPSSKIEDEILTHLDDELKESALKFIAWLNENSMAPRQWFGPGFWRVPHANGYLCGIVVEKDRFRFWFFNGNYSGEFNGSFVTTIHDNVRSCISCTTDCQFGKDAEIFGKKFENACFQFPIQFENPDNSILENIKELIEYWKVIAPHTNSWHVHD